MRRRHRDQIQEIVALGNLPGAEDDDGRADRARRRRGRQAPTDLGQLAEDLSDHFETRLLIQSGGKMGRIVVEFGVREDREQLRPHVSSAVAAPG